MNLHESLVEVFYRFGSIVGGPCEPMRSVVRTGR